MGISQVMQAKKAISNFQKVYGLNVDGKMTDKTRKNYRKYIICIVVYQQGKN